MSSPRSVLVGQRAAGLAAAILAYEADEDEERRRFFHERRPRKPSREGREVRLGRDPANSTRVQALGMERYRLGNRDGTHVVSWRRSGRDVELRRGRERHRFRFARSAARIELREGRRRFSFAYRVRSLSAQPAETRTRRSGPRAGDLLGYLLGYDGNASRSVELTAELRSAPTRIGGRPLAAWARALMCFARLEELFSTNRPSPKNLRRWARLGDLEPALRDKLEPVLAHYRPAPGPSGAARERALLRLRAAHAGRAQRIQLARELVRASVDQLSASPSAGDMASLQRALELLEGLHLGESFEAEIYGARRTLEAALGREDREHSADRINAWLGTADPRHPIPPPQLLNALFDATPLALQDASSGLTHPDTCRRGLARALHLQRFYAPSDGVFHARLLREEGWIDRLDLADGRTLLTLDVPAPRVLRGAEALLTAASGLRARSGFICVHAAELFVTSDTELNTDGLVRWLLASLVRRFSHRFDTRRLTLSFHQPNRPLIHQTLFPARPGVEVGGRASPIHPAVAERFGIRPKPNQHWERLEAGFDLYCTRADEAQATTAPRLLVLGDLQRAAETDPWVFALLAASRTLRTRLENPGPAGPIAPEGHRILFALPAAADFDPGRTAARAHRLAPAAAGLGIEEVTLRFGVHGAAGTGPILELAIHPDHPRDSVQWRFPQRAA